MKKITALLLIFTPLTTFLQPTLTESNMRPVIGETFKYSRFEWTGEHPSEGEHQIWDYSTVASVYTYDYEFVPLEETPDYLDFYGSNSVTHDISNSGYEHAIFNIDKAERYGSVLGDGYYYKYYNPRSYLQFPFTYGDSFVDTYTSAYQTPEPDFDISYSGTVEVTAIGYGTLKLPDGILENVLCVEEDNTFLEWYDGWSTEVHNELIRFYKPGIHFPVLILFKSQSGSNVGWYFDDPFLTVDPVETEFSIYPNPVDDQLFIQYDYTGENVVVQLYDIAGQIVMTARTDLSSPINLSHLTPGVYYLQMGLGEREIMQKIIKN